MRLLAIFPLLCLIAAFVISMLGLFAGSRIGFLEQYDLLTLNTSLIGQVNIAQTLGSLNVIPDDAKTQILSFVEDHEDTAAQLVHTVARELNIHDWYAMHVLDYCEGYYTPGPYANASVTPTKNTTFCADTSTTFTFNITQILERELRGGTTLADLDFPDDIQQAIDALNVATRAMFILYCVGIGLVGLGVIFAALAVFASGVLHAWLNALWGLLAFLVMGIASALATAIAVVVVNAVKQYGNKIGVDATIGRGFLALTWVATALVLLATFTWVFDCCAGRRKERRPYKV